MNGITRDGARAGPSDALARDVEREACPRGAAVAWAPRILATSAAVPELLGEEWLVRIAKVLLDGAPLVDRLDGLVCAAAAPWLRDHPDVRRVLSARAFQPGATVWMPLGGPAALEYVPGSHALPHPRVTEVRALALASGEVAVVAAGMLHRPRAASGAWLRIRLIRPWLRPEVLYWAALDPEARARLTPEVGELLGSSLGFPVSIREFLEVEERAATGRVGRMKGSGT